MNRTTHLSSTPRWVVALLGVLAFALLFLALGTGTARADGSGNADQTTGFCAEDAAVAAGVTHLNCTANDVRIAEATNITIHDDGCTGPGDTVTFTADFDVVLTSQARYDLGIWFANDGDPNGDGAYTGSCTVATPAYAPDLPWLDLDQAIAGQEADTCGDIDSSHNPLYPRVTMTVVCVDDDGDGNLDLPYVTSWRIPGANELCTSPLQAFPGTPSKCKSDAGFDVPIPVPYTGTIEVIKALVPYDDPGVFGLQVDGTTEFTDASDGDTTGPVVVAAGISTDNPPIGESHSVGEVAGTATTLAHYDSSISCVDEDGDTANSIGVGPLDVFVEPDDAWVCTIVNENMRPKLTLIKRINNDNGGTLGVSDFPLFVDATLVVSGVANAFDPGDYEASETGQAGYVASGWTGDCDPDGSVTLAYGDDKTCYITNTAQQAYITVNKIVDNTNGGVALPDDFKLTLGGTATLTGVKVPVDPGTYKAAETLLPGYTFNGFTGDCNETGDVTVALGESKTCTLTNTANPAGISIEKGTNGVDADTPTGPYVLVGNTVIWAYNVTNTGQAALEHILIEDSDKDVSVTCPQATLAVGETMTCTASGLASIGQYENTGYAFATAVTGAPVKDTDPSHYFGSAPAIDITKDGAPTPIPVNNPGDKTTEVTWTITVENTGNVPLHDVVVTDALVAACDRAIGDLAIGASTSYPCTSSLTPDSLSWTFTNVAVVTGDGPEGSTVTDEDSAKIDPVFVKGTGQLGDTVWLDKDKDGVQDADEPGINGAKVILKDADGNVIATQTTFKGAWDGFYKFLELDAGKYTVSLDMSSVSGALTTAGAFTIDLADGEDYVDADFGVAEVLPKTGMDAAALALLGLALLAAGAVAVLFGRRRGENT